MEVRRRNTGRTVDVRFDEPEEVSYGGDGEEAYREGLDLYSQAEQTNFEDTDVLTKSIRRVIRASEKGVDEASVWMKGFLDSTAALPVALPQNLVRTMQFMSEATPTEKQVRLAAKSMFHKMAGERNAISRKEISEKAKGLLQSEEAAPLKKSSRLLEGSIHRLMNDALVINQTDEVTEDAFAEAAMTYARGELGSAQGEVCELTPEQMTDFTNANIVKKVTEYPKQTLHYVKNVTLKTIEKRGVRWIWSYIPTKQFYWLVAIYLVPMLTVNFIVSSIFSLVSAGALIAMIVATMQVAANSVGASMQQEFVSIFQYFSTDSKNKIDPTLSRSELISRSMVPYLTFFIAMVVTVLSLGLAHQIPYQHEFLALLAGFFTIASFIQFEIYSSPLLLVSLASRLVAWFYAFLLVISPLVHVPDFLFIMAKDLVSIPFFGGYSFTINLMSILQFPLHVSVICYLLFTKTWFNIFSGLGPYVICICWFVLCRNFFSTSSAENLIMATLGVVLIFGTVPFTPFLFIASPLFVLYLYGIFSPEFIASVLFVAIGALFVLFVAANFQKIKEAKWLNIPLEYVFLLGVVSTVVMIIIGSQLYARRFDVGKLETVTLEQYTEYCGPGNWHEGNMVQTQLNCLHLQDRVFESQGVIKSVKISEIMNTNEASLSTLPSSIKSTLTCLLGGNTPMCGNRTDMTTCVKSKCHFQHSYLYTYEVKLDMPLASEQGNNYNILVALVASSKFRPTILNMTTGMNVRFNSTFISGMGSDEVRLSAISILLPQSVGVSNGTDDEDEWSEAVEGLFWKTLRSLRNALYFVLEVLFGYTPTRVHKS